jgi:hypothetical protein
MASVPSNQITFHPASYGDFNGRVFHWDGGLYRGVAASRADLYNRLFDDGTIARLVERKVLVPTERTKLKVDGFDLVLKHRKLPVVSYAYEWSAGMLKDAALLALDLEIELAARGLTLQDAHPWNILFDGPNPCWVDFGSIVPARADTLWRAREEFDHFYLNPLLLMSRGHHRVARRMLVDSDDGVIAPEAAALTGLSADRPPLRHRLTQTARSLAKRLLPSAARSAIRSQLLPALTPPDVSASRPAFLRDLRDRIAAITLRSPLHCAVHVNGSSGQDDLDAARSRAVEYALGRVKPVSAFEVSYESPFYGALAARAGVRTVAVAVNEEHVDALYRHAREHRLDLLPLVMDVRNPSPGFGLCGQTAAPATARLASDLVIALDVTHHLGVRYRLNFDQVAAGLGTFARRALLIDFVDGAHPSTRAYLTPDFAGYTAANFEAALRRQFPWVERAENTDRPTFLCFKENSAG